jgi:hypothetical protein
MRRGITIPRVLLALVLVTAVSREDMKPLVDLVAYVMAIVLVVGVVTFPCTVVYGVWLYVRHCLGYPPPGWVATLLDRLGRLRAVLTRAKATYRAAAAVWRERASEPAEDDGDTEEPDPANAGPDPASA